MHSVQYLYNVQSTTKVTVITDSTKILIFTYYLLPNDDDCLKPFRDQRLIKELLYLQYNWPSDIQSLSFCMTVTPPGVNNWIQTVHFHQYFVRTYFHG